MTITFAQSRTEILLKISVARILCIVGLFLLVKMLYSLVLIASTGDFLVTFGQLCVISYMGYCMGVLWYMYPSNKEELDFWKN